MKRDRWLVIVVVLLGLAGCHQESCKNVTTYSKIDTRFFGYLFKVGTYWVYRDSVDGVTDSQYVYESINKVHYRNPQDTPNHLYQTISPGGAKSSLYCGPYYLDDLSENIVSYRTGSSADTTRMYILSGDSRIKFLEHFNSTLATEVDIMEINAKDSGLIQRGIGSTPPSTAQDTTYLWYEGEKSSVLEPIKTFTNVKVFRVRNSSTNTARFKYPADIYFASNYGIVKIVEHRPSGDVPWILTNYHIEN
ncbi:MAG: hypothetical protein JSS76_19370 [Bacteroidetes bacterium]|nr:hypothetical protein [Bacteroidota bacterium]